MGERRFRILGVLLIFLLLTAIVPIIGIQSDTLGSASLTGEIRDRGVDTDGDNLFNYLEIGVEINVATSGFFSVYVSGLQDNEGKEIDVWGSASGYLDVGLALLNVSLSGYRIRASRLNATSVSHISLQDGNYSFINNVNLSREYPYTDFDAPAILTGIISDKGLDTDADDTYNFLEIGVQVNVSDPGNYEVSVSGLLDSEKNHIDVHASKSLYLKAGLQFVYLSLDGTRIYLSGRNPEYVNHISLYFWEEEYWSEGYWDYLKQVPLSDQYNYTQFDPPAAMLTGKIFDRGLDTDGDGTFDYLEVSVEVDVTEPGEYKVSIWGLYEISGNLTEKYRYYIDVWGSASGHLDVGLGVLNVSLYGPAIYYSRHNPTHVDWISLYASENFGSKYLDSISEVPLLGNYSYTDFDIPVIILGVVSDQGIDNDADGYFDFLEVGVQFDVRDPGTYSLYASGLSDANSTCRVWNVRDSKSMYLDKGIHTVKFYFYGPSIYVSRCNPNMVSYISARAVSPAYHYWMYESKENVPLTSSYSYTQFDAPFTAAETKFVVYPDGRVGVEGAVKYTDMVPQYTGPTAQGSFNLTSTQAVADLTVNLPPEIANEFPYNSTTVEMLAEYSDGLLDLGINSSMILPSIAETVYPYNATDGTFTATYSKGILNIEVEGNTTLPPSAASQFPFNITAVGTYSPNTLNGTITFSILDDFTFDDVNVDFEGNQTDLTLNGTVHVVFNVPLGDFIIRNETELIEIIDQLKSELPEMVWNMTGGLLNVTTLEIDYELTYGMVPGASVTFRMNVHGDFLRALAYVMSGGRNEMLLHPVLNEAYQSVQSSSFDVRYSHTTLEASVKLAFSYDVQSLLDYVLTPPAGTTPYVMTSYDMTPTLWMRDVVMIEEVSDAGDIIANQTGDIIAFYRPDDPRYVVIHRAINKTYLNGTWYFTTKGDWYQSPDPWSVPENLVIGKAVPPRVPLLGYLVSYPYFSYPYYYYPYPQGTTEARLELMKAVFNSVESMSIQLSYSSVDKRFDFRLTQVDKLKTLKEEIALILPEVLPPDTPPEIRSFVESLLNTTYASVDSANVSFVYGKGKADFEATVNIEGDVSTEANYVKDLYFQLIGAQYSRYNMTVPWQVDFINQTKVDISNLKISSKLSETSFEARIEGLTLIPPTDALNATHFKLERLFNLTAPQYSWQREFPGENQRLRITIEGGSNGTHGVTLFRDPQGVPEPDATASHQMIWHNQTLSSLKDLVFSIREPGQYDLGWIVGKVVDADSSLPIVGASITADGFAATTDINGCYVISNVPPGDYTVTVSAPGYSTESKSTRLHSGVTTTVNFEQALIGTVNGTVRDASTGLPISGASISINGYTTTTNTDGYYEIIVPHGDYTITASATGYLEASKPVHVDIGIVTTVDFALSPAGTLTVNTTPVAGEVFVNGTSWGVANVSRTVKVGTYNVSFGDVPGYYTPAWQIANVQKGIETTVIGVYEPKLGAIEGTVTDASTGLPISGVTVFADGYSATTDSSGYYSITDVLVGTYTVTAEATGYYSDSKTGIVVELGATATVNFTLSLVVGWIDGYITDAETEAALVGATVSANGVSTTTDAIGYYKIELVPGDYTVTASASEYASKSKIATVKAEETTTLNFKLAPEGVVVEEITDPELVNDTNPFVVNATEEAVTSLIISEISDPVTIVVKNVTDPDVDPPPGTWKVLGNYVQISVNNTDITVNATIRIYYTQEQLEASGLDESTLTISYWNATLGEWVAVESHVNTDEHYVWANIDHLSLWVLMGQKPSPLWTQPQFLATVAIAVAVIAVATVILLVRKRKLLKPPKTQPKTS